jgi:hypothetical protein
MPALTQDQQEFFNVQTRHQLMMKLAYDNYYDALRKVIQKNEDKITQIKKQALSTRLKMVRSSIFKELVEIEVNFKNAVDTIESKIKSVELDLDMGRMEIELQKITMEMRRVQTQEKQLAAENLLTSSQFEMAASKLGAYGDIVKTVEKREADLNRTLADRIKGKKLTGMDVLESIISEHTEIITYLDDVAKVQAGLDTLFASVEQFRDDKGQLQLPPLEAEDFQKKLKGFNAEMSRLNNIQFETAGNIDKGII